MRKRSVGIIGAGNVGTALAMALQRKHYTVKGLYCRTAESGKRASGKLEVDCFEEPEEVALQADIVFITTPDRVIEDVCKDIAESGGFREGQVVVHTSGAHSSELLNPAKRCGSYIMSMHPLQTFPSADTGFQNLSGSFFTLEGDEEALEAGRELVEAFDGLALTIPTEMKPLYHASACVACNYFVALLDVALKMMEHAGVPRDKGLPALLPLLEGTFANVKKVGVPRALTGPIDRGDASTLSSHIATLEKEMPSFVELYKALGRYTSTVANEKGTLSIEGKESVLKALE